MIAFFIRHGQSLSNAEPERDLPELDGDHLSELGRGQAERAAEHLGGLGVTRLWSSPMGRALETAAPISARLGLAVEELEELREMRQADGFGELSGEQQRLERWSNWMAEHPDQPGYAPPGGESFDDLGARVRRLKLRLIEAGDERVLAVSHGIFLRFFFCDSFLGGDFRPFQARRLWQIRTLNCGLSAFEHRPPGDPLNPALEEWLCLSWMSRPWDQPWSPGPAGSPRSDWDR